MTHINSDYSKLTESYLFYETKLRAERFEAAHPERSLLRLGIGDVTLPLAPVVIEALHRAVDEQARQESFHGYMPELGMGFMKQAAAANYARRGVTVDPEEVFVCYGIGDDLGAIGGLFARENRVAVVEPAYPAYADTNIMSGRTIVPIPGTEENGFLPPGNYDWDPEDPEGNITRYLESFGFTLSALTEEEEGNLLSERLKEAVTGDMEDADGYKRRYSVTDRETLTDMCIAFASVCEVRGYKCGVYASYDWLENRLDTEAFVGIPIWCAQWDEDCDWEETAIWQFTDAWVIDGQVFDGNLCLGEA